jgi:hypothetical protein
MDSNNEYTHRGFWGELSITMPPSFPYTDKVFISQPQSHVTYPVNMSITVVEEEKLPF